MFRFARASALVSFCALALVALSPLGCAGEAPDDGDNAESELGGGSAPAPLSIALADVLSGGELRCAEQGPSIQHRGDVIVSVAPAVRSGSRWRAAIKLSGKLSWTVFSSNDVGTTVSSTRLGSVEGTRSINSGGDIGNGYYCGGGVAAYHCGPDRVDRVRFFMQGQELRCEVQSTRDEAYSNQVTQTVSASPVRLSGCFDEAFYLEGNPDVASAVARGDFHDGRAHFDAHGKREGRRGCRCEFDESYYLAQNTDVAAAVAQGAFLSGRHHFALQGAAEGRAGCPSSP